MLPFALLLLFAVVHGQSTQTITAPATLPTSVEGDEPVACTNHLLQYCPRSGFPYYANGFVGAADENNPYKLPYGRNFTSGETASSYSCQSKYLTSLNNYYNYTAEVTAGKVVPPSTIQSGYTSFGTFTSWVTRYTSVGIGWVSYTSETVITNGQGGQTTATRTYINSNGIQTVSTATLDLSIISFLQESDTPTYVPYTTVTNPSESREVIAAHTPYTFVKNFEYTAIRGEGCCQTCSLHGNSVQILYWPTPMPNDAPKTLINSNNFTFVYPTNYLALQSLYATDLCGTLTPQVVKSTTIAIAEENLSTAIAYRYNTTQYSGNNAPSIFPLYTKADFAKQQTAQCEDIITTAWIAGYSPGFDSTSVSGDSLYTLTYNPCSPTLSVPTELFTINKAWTSCVPGINGLYDPPYSLTAGNGLVAFNSAHQTTTAIADQTSTGSVESVATNTVTTPSTGPTAAAPTPTQTIPAGTPTSLPPIESLSLSTELSTDPSTTLSQASDTVPTNSRETITPPTSPVASGPPAVSDASQMLGNSKSIVDPTQSSVGQGDPNETALGQENQSETVVSLDPTNTAFVIGIPSASTAALSYMIGSRTLLPGGSAVTFSGTVLSLGPGGSSLAIDGSTQNAGTFFSTETAPEYAVGTTQKLEGGGPAIVISGTTVSLATGVKSVVQGGRSTLPVSQFLGANPTTTQGGLGGAIKTLGGFVPNESAGGSNNSLVGANAGSTAVNRPVVWLWIVALGGGLLCILWL